MDRQTRKDFYPAAVKALVAFECRITIRKAEAETFANPGTVTHE